MIYCLEWERIRNKSVNAFLNVAMVTIAELKIVTDLDGEDRARKV